MRFDLQMFGGKGASVQNYEPSDEQRALWNLQIKSAEQRQPNELKLNQLGAQYLEKVTDLEQKYGSYDEGANANNYLARGNLAISQVDQSMRKLARIADWQREYESDGVTQASWQTQGLEQGKNTKAADNLRIALRGTGSIIGTAADGTIIRDNGFTGELGDYVKDAFFDLNRGTTKIYEFVAGNTDTKVIGINENIGDLVTDTGTVLEDFKDGVKSYKGKYDTAATTANTSTNTAQSSNDSLVSGLKTSVNSYNTLQSGKADNAESLL